MRDLSILIPARNEEWLSRTVADVCENKRGNTEVIVVLDGEWPQRGRELAQHPDVQVIKLSTAIGQRAATNLAALVSEAAYVMKLDAHCSMAPGFDTVLIEAAKELGPLVTQIPAQKHLHVYDQICDTCGKRTDQSPVLKECRDCKGTSWHREIVWEPRASPTSSAWRFDSDLHFQYWSGARSKQKGIKYPEVLSCLGACWFMARERYCALGGMDEDHGSWGAMGTEVGCKSWLSGGRMVVNKATWFAHFFRVGGHKFPYEIHGADQQYAQQYSQNIWRGGHWPGQVLPLRWLIDKFWPVPGWTEAQRDALPRDLTGCLRTGHDRFDDREPQATETDQVDRGHLHQGGHVGGEGNGALSPSVGVVYYSDLRGDAAILGAVREQVRRSVNGHAIVSATLKPLDFGHNIVLPLERGYLTMFRQILAGLEALETDYAFLVEHDVIYAPDHFRFIPPRDDCYFYNTNVWHVDAKTGRAVTYLAKRTSQLCANRQLLVEHYRTRIARVQKEGFTRAMGFEPGSHGRKERVDDVPSDVWQSDRPNIDIRHGRNLTPSRWSPEQFRDKRNCQGWQEGEGVPGWGRTLGCFSCFLNKVQRGELPVTV